MLTELTESRVFLDLLCPNMPEIFMLEGHTCFSIMRVKNSLISLRYFDLMQLKDLGQVQAG